MSCPLRIEFPYAWHHAMKRSAGYRNIFYNKIHHLFFLDLLSQITKMVQVEINDFCLMDNHYHLLIHTPEGNFDRQINENPHLAELIRKVENLIG